MRPRPVEGEPRSVKTPASAPISTTCSGTSRQVRRGPIALEKIGERHANTNRSGARGADARPCARRGSPAGGATAGGSLFGAPLRGDTNEDKGSAGLAVGAA